MHKHFFSWQFMIYLIGGVLSALVDIGMLQLLLGRGLPLLPATSAAFLCGLLVNYAFHAKVTFGQMTGYATFLRYLCLVAANYLLTILLVSAGVALFQSALMGKLISLPIAALNGFLMGKLWVFRK